MALKQIINIYHQSIGFGSCNRQNLNQSFFKDIRNQHPDLTIWLWIGDAYYTPNITVKGQLHSILNLTNNLYYSEFRENVIIEGVFDDHDYGVNDAGKYVTNYNERKSNYFDFLYNTLPNNFSYSHRNDNIERGGNYSKYINRILSSGLDYDKYFEQSLHDLINRDSNEKIIANNKSEQSISETDIHPLRGVYKSFNTYLSTSDSEPKIQAKVKFIMLDTRSFRDYHYIPSVGEYEYDSLGVLHIPFMAIIAAAIRLFSSVMGLGNTYDGDVLGEEQWLWLENILSRKRDSSNICEGSNNQENKKSVLDDNSYYRQIYDFVSFFTPSSLISSSTSNDSGSSSSGIYDVCDKPDSEDSDVDYHVIVSSIQVFTTNPVVESWGHFPYAKQRLVRLLERYQPRGVIFLSGDVHHAEISELKVGTDSNHKSNGDNSYKIQQNIKEVTSSGLTHTCADSVITKYLGLCPLMLNTFPSHRSINNTAHSNTNDASTGFKNDFFIGKNYGVIKLQSNSKATNSNLYFTPAGVYEHELNISVYSIETQTIVLSTTVLPVLINLSGNKSSSSYYYETFFRFSEEIVINIFITILSIFIGFTYVIYQFVFE